MSWWHALAGLLASEDTVLITVAKTQGSAPREAGACMLVTLTQTVDTIGGGHLEWEGIAQARAMLLQTSAQPEVRRYALGATLGQCCGGVVWLAFERIDRMQHAEWLARVGQLDRGMCFERSLIAAAASQWTCSPDAAQRNPGAHLTFHTPPSPGPAGHPLPQGEGMARVSANASSPLPSGEGWPNRAGRGANASSWQFTQHIGNEGFPITVFGAGHVGAAVVRLLAMLDARIRWVDPREDLFQNAPAGVECIATDAPEEAVASAPPDSWFLVLTHSHALDLTLCEHILRRQDVAWFGLIGSQTKRARFEHKLRDLGLDPSRMTCPIGVAGIHDKAPAAIAIAVLAQILQEKEIQTPSRTSRSGAIC